MKWIRGWAILLTSFCSLSIFSSKFHPHNYSFFFFSASLFGIIVFFGVIFVILFVLILTYFGVRDGRCCWHNSNKNRSGKKGSEEELSIIAAGESAGESDYDDFDAKQQFTMTPKVGTYTKLVNDEPSQPPSSKNKHSVVFLDNQVVNKRLLNLKIPESVKSGYTGYTSTEDDDLVDHDGVGLATNVRQNLLKAHRNFIDGARIRFSLLYSKSDFFLMLTINEVEGVPSKAENGFDFLQVAITLLPAKKYRSKTKLVHQQESRAIFNDEPFKFSNISREKLKESAFRIRVQGKKFGRHVTLGEVVVHLMDVAQRGGGFETWRPLTKTKR